MASKTALVIGAGFSGLSAACVLAKNGFDVTVLEKNEGIGGRARKFEHEGFVFDMGPSWYWMPDVFENFFNYFGKSASDYYRLIRLDPSYRVVFKGPETVDIPANYEDFRQLLERMETGSAKQLDRFLKHAKYKYEVGVNDLVYRPGNSVAEFLNLKLLYDSFRLNIFQSFEKHIGAYFKDRRLKMLMEFPILFLGAVAKNTPALYSLMNYADIKLGTWYPEGGMYKIIDGMERLARELGVKIITAEEVTGFNFAGNSIKEVKTVGGTYTGDVVVASADYHHIEQNLLPERFRNYTEEYWEKRTFAPSSLIFYLGLRKSISNLLHHNLFFDGDFAGHTLHIYSQPSWPDDPLFYVCVPSKTDPTVAPSGCENLFILMPAAPGIKDSEEIREKYFSIIIDRIEQYTGETLKDSIVFKRSYAHADFAGDYHAYKGNAYGLANTLLQTAFLKPKIKSNKVENLYFTGQLTVPGPGVPPALISGRVVAGEIIKEWS